MRFLLVIAALVILFILLARAAPPSLHIPLYCTFTAAGLAYAWWERRRLAARRTRLQQELADHQPGRLEEE